VNILLDTQILLWQFAGDPRLTPRFLAVLNQPDVTKFASDVSIWEAAIKIRTGRLALDLDDFEAAIAQSGYSRLPIERRHFKRLLTLPDIHKDPFDHLLIAQAQADGLSILTADEKFRAYPVALAI
jgi:PIN domain nuclease of toxin-antitoxin system